MFSLTKQLRERFYNLCILLFSLVIYSYLKTLYTKKRSDSYFKTFKAKKSQNLKIEGLKSDQNIDIVQYQYIPRNIQFRLKADI
jgi:hypothetical protein